MGEVRRRVADVCVGVCRIRAVFQSAWPLLRCCTPPTARVTDLKVGSVGAGAVYAVHAYSQRQYGTRVDGPLFLPSTRIRLVRSGAVITRWGCLHDDRLSGGVAATLHINLPLSANTAFIHRVTPHQQEHASIPPSIGGYPQSAP